MANHGISWYYMANHECGMHITRVWEAHAGGHWGRWWWTPASLLSQHDCFKAVLPLEVPTESNFCLWPLLSQPAPWSLCRNMQLPEPSRSKVYGQVAWGRPAPGNKSELILSCSMQVLLSTADPQATAHLGSSVGRVGAGLTPTPLPGSVCQELAAAWAGLASWQPKEGLLVAQLISVPATDSLCSLGPATCLLCAQFAICGRQVIKAVISLDTVINSLEKEPIQLLVQLRNAGGGYSQYGQREGFSDCDSTAKISGQVSSFSVAAWLLSILSDSLTVWRAWGNLTSFNSVS